MEFDEQFLQEMGLATMPEDQKQRFLTYVQEEVEIRIGEQISRGVPEEKLQEFDAITDPEDAARWLEENRPDYRDIVARTIEDMKAEIRANRSKLLGVSVAEPQPQPTPAPEPTPVTGLALDPNAPENATNPDNNSAVYSNSPTNNNSTPDYTQDFDHNSTPGYTQDSDHNLASDNVQDFNNTPTPANNPAPEPAPAPAPEPAPIDLNPPADPNAPIAPAVPDYDTQPQEPQPQDTPQQDNSQPQGF